MGSILQNGMLSESNLAAWLAAIIAEIAFYQWKLQENGIQGRNQEPARGGAQTG